MNYTIEEIIRILLKECFLHRYLFVLIFVFVSTSFLVAGVLWPKRYTASTVIHIDDRNIIQPLMQGAAVTTDNRDNARNAREIIMGNKIIKEVLELAGWSKDVTDPIAIENIAEDVKQRIQINNVGGNLIRITFQDSDPKRSYLTVKNMALLFVDQGKESKVQESRAAYEFIEEQVDEYSQKLNAVDRKIKALLSNNPDARPGTQATVTQRISELQRSIESTSLQLKEAMIQKKSLEVQLSGEASITISQSRESSYRERISSLRSERENLLLTYTETYPDVIRINQQIEDLKASLRQEMDNRENKNVATIPAESEIYDQSVLVNPVYQTLRTNLSEVETQIATLNTRLNEMNSMLGVEYEKIRRIQESESIMNELTRDYEVNEEIYQDLLRRRENARVSRSLGAEEQGMTFKIQEPARMPLQPSGLRFLHFLLLGIVGGILAPVGFIYMMVQFDNKIRVSRMLTELTNIKVLADIPHYKTSAESSTVKQSYIKIVSVISFVIVLYIMAAVLRINGVI